MTVIALLCVDKFGRRRLLVTGALLMGISIMTLGAVCQLDATSRSDQACVDHTDCIGHIEHNHTFLVHTTQKPNLVLHNTTFNLNNTFPTNISHDHYTTLGPNMHNINISASVIKTSETTTESLAFRRRRSSDNKYSMSHDNTHVANTTQDSGVESDGSMVERVIGFTALMCYVAAYGFSFGPGKFTTKC